LVFGVVGEDEFVIMFLLYRDVVDMRGRGEAEEACGTVTLDGFVFPQQLFMSIAFTFGCLWSIAMAFSRV
jgi:hypothetical protein